MYCTLTKSFGESFKLIQLQKSIGSHKHFHSKAKKPLPKILVVGGGAGGLELVTALGNKLGKRKLAHIKLCDGRMTHVWKPLLHEVSTGALNVGEDELSYFVHANTNRYGYHYGWMSGLDRDRKVIKTQAIFDLEGTEVSGPQEVEYDTLVLAVGGKTNDFGIPGVMEHCFKLDSPTEAESLRRRLMGQALHFQFKKLQKLTIGIVGAGPTGVELAAEMHRTICTLHSYGANIKHADVEISILEAGTALLPGTPSFMSDFASKELKRQGIRVRTGCKINKVTKEGFHLEDGSLIEKNIKVWTAGVKAPDFLKDLDLKTDNFNKIIVNKFLQSSDPSIYALGDCSRCVDLKDPAKLVPATAQCAHQQAEWLFQKIKNDINGKPTPPFMFVSQGMLVSLGHTTAVGRIDGLKNFSNYHVRGRSAKFIYSTLYRMHQAAVYGNLNALALILGDKLRGATLPEIKIH